MREVKVSIIVPVHNAKNYIAETVNSVLSQTEKDWELILALVVPPIRAVFGSPICPRFTFAGGSIWIIWISR